MSQRTRIVIVAVFCVLVLGGAAGYIAVVRHGQNAVAAQPSGARTRDDLATVLRGPHILFRNTAVGQGYSQVAAVPIDDPGGPRALANVACERVYATRTIGICLSANRGLATSYKSELYTPNWQPVRELPVTGLPSRARISRDGKLVATTTFVFGDSYTNPGQFSTRTTVSQADGSSSVDIEQFKLLVDGHELIAADRNLWGVTFVDDDAFYATAASGARTWLVRGSLAAGTLTAVHEDVECPSLSPDGTRIAYKKHGDLPGGQWQLAVLDLASGQETVLAEQRSVDDQPEWLDDTHVLYGLPRKVQGSASSDIWEVPADGSGTPTLLIQDAWSPAVVR